jgi:hypothetical protein
VRRLVIQAEGWGSADRDPVRGNGRPSRSLTRRIVAEAVAWALLAPLVRISSVARVGVLGLPPPAEGTQVVGEVDVAGRLDA